MDIKWLLELVKKIKLGDIQLQLKGYFKGKNIGLININVENYKIELSDSEFWKTFASAKFTPEIEDIAKQKAAEILEQLTSEFYILPKAISANVATITVATSAMEAIGLNPKADDEVYKIDDLESKKK
jgi:hypothetical protein